MSFIRIVVMFLTAGSVGVLSQSPDNSGSSFVAVSLPRGVRMVVPKGWRVFGQEWTNSFKASAEAAMDLSGVPAASEVLTKQLVLFAANSVPLETYASIRVSSIKPPSISKAELSALSLRDLKSMESEVVLTWQRVMASQKLEFLGLESLRREMLGGRLALVTEYRRSGSVADGPVHVQINQIVTGEQVVQLTLSYRESEGVLWRPVLEKVRRSVEIKEVH